MDITLQEMTAAYFPQGLAEIRRYGDGHIHDTYLAQTTRGEFAIVQRVNRFVFPQPELVMENIEKVTSYLGNKLRELGQDPQRKTLQIIPTQEGASFWVDSQGGFWRAYRFIHHTVTYQSAPTPALFESAAKGFGGFMELLEGFDPGQLHEIIPAFHHTPTRLAQLEQAARQDPLGRFAEVEKEYAFVQERRDFLPLLTKALERGELPLRVTHNDTKLNNILFDQDSNEALCVIDLDTVMPGTVLYDFGDAVRFGASTAAEDEPDLSKVAFQLSYFSAYARGYWLSAGDSLTPLEREWMPEGAKMMTLECGMRFLADYLNGDVYFKTNRPSQNLDRARTQFALVEQMEQQWDRMKQAAMGKE